MKKSLLVVLLTLVLTFVAIAPVFADGDYTIAVVPKMTSIAWFQRMEVGVNEFAKETGVDAFYTGPSEGDGALQAQFIEDLIAQGVDAICVVPFSTEALEPVLKKAREAGILVIAHEASGMENIDYDIEAFNNDAYGEHYMARLGELMGGKGEYLLEVGGLRICSGPKPRSSIRKPTSRK